MERALRPALGLRWAFISKWFMGKSLWAVTGIWAMTYYGLYCAGDWQRQTGWKYHVSKPPSMPGDPEFPKKNPKYERGEAWMYNDQVRIREKQDELFQTNFSVFQGFSKNTVDLKTSTPVSH